jgi:hypothetical protein
MHTEMGFMSSNAADGLLILDQPIGVASLIGGEAISQIWYSTLQYSDGLIDINYGECVALSFL